MLNVISGLFSEGAPPVSPTSYESISTVTLGSAQSSATFSSIPSTFKHLQIRCMISSATAGNALQIRFNSDSGTNYNTHFLLGNGSTASAGAYVASRNTAMLSMNYNGVSTSQPTAQITDILDYQNTNKYKVIRTLAGSDLNGSGEIDFNSGLWLSTSAITSITLNLESSGNFNANSSFALYGIKG